MVPYSSVGIHKRMRLVKLQASCAFREILIDGCVLDNCVETNERMKVVKPFASCEPSSCKCHRALALHVFMFRPYLTWN